MARTTRVVLLTGDYADRLDAIYRAALDAAKDTTPLLGGETDPAHDLAEEYRALKAEAEAAGTVVEMAAVGRSRFRDLKAAHPPRTEGDPEAVKADRLAGVDTDSIADDLVHASVTSPAFKSRAAFDEWADTLSEGEWQALVVRAWDLTNGARLDPKDLPASPIPSTGPS